MLVRSSGFYALAGLSGPGAYLKSNHSRVDLISSNP